MAEKTDVYFDEVAPGKKTNATVTTTMFVDYTGDQYPIRNITSVQIRYKPSKFATKLCKWLGLFSLIVGVLMLLLVDTSSDPDSGYAAWGIFGLGVLLVVTWLNAKVYIVIGAGGTTQDTYQLPLWQKGADEHVKRLSTAINNAISGLQNN